MVVVKHNYNITLFIRKTFTIKKEEVPAEIKRYFPLSNSGYKKYYNYKKVKLPF